MIVILNKKLITYLKIIILSLKLIIKKKFNLLNGYVTNDTFNNFKKEINQTITNSVNLDKIQKAINDGCGVNMTMPSANSNKLSLPIWTGTATKYATITPVAGMTYNIIDE